MSWPNEQQQQKEFSTQHSYTGYTGSFEQPSQMFEQPSSYQQQPFHQPEAQSPYPNGQMPYSYSPPPVPSLDGIRLAAALSYVLGWFSGLLFLLFGGENRYIRFHALQSIAFFGAVNLINVAVFMSWIATRGFHNHWFIILSFLFLLLVNIIALVGWFVGIVQAARGVYYKMPFVGNAIAQHVHGNPTLK
jgi:uncharacterized membrane protein